MKHHLVQMEPVAMRARFCVRDSFSAGRRKSDAPARTTPHFMMGALYKSIKILSAYSSSQETQFHPFRVWIGDIEERSTSWNA